MDLLVSIIIPTYKRAPFLKHSLNALKQQSYRNFEVIVVAKLSNDATEDVLEEYRAHFPLKVVIQQEGFVSRAYNLGLEEASGEIIVIMDDDSIPDTTWLREYVEIFENHSDLGGISGQAISANFDVEGKLYPVNENYILHTRWQEYFYSRWSYNKPLDGMYNWLIFIGRDGLVHSRPYILNTDLKNSYPSLLFMGANMSVRKKAIKGIHIDENLILGFAYEQLLGYEIWLKGYKLIYNPNIKLMHIVHEESLGRFFKTPQRAAHREAEYVLTFFLLKSKNNEISWIPYILQMISLIVSRGLSSRIYGIQIASSRIYGILYGFILGCAYMISQKIGGKFSIANALHKFIY